jgi:hypothetical protein
MLPLTPQAMLSTTQLMLLAPNQMSLPIQDKTLELNLYQHKSTTLNVASVDAYETKWK